MQREIRVMELFQENSHHKETGQFLLRSCVSQANWDERYSNPLLPWKNRIWEMSLNRWNRLRTMQTVAWQCNKSNIMISRKYFLHFSNRFSFLQAWYRKITLKGFLRGILVCYVLKASLNQESHPVFWYFQKWNRNSCLLQCSPVVLK